MEPIEFKAAPGKMYDICMTGDMESDLSPAVIREGSENYRFTVYIKSGFLIDKAILEEQYNPQVSGGTTKNGSAAAASGMAAYCSNCGHKLNANDNFCPKCGKKRASL